MILRFKTTFKGFLFLALLYIGPLATGLWANPSDNVTSDEPLYQRVKALEAYGLLDSQDQAVLDQGRVVTKLELDFFTEKAKANYQASQGLQVALASQAASTSASKATPAPTAVTATTPATDPDFVQGFSLYQQKQYAQAVPKFQAVIQQNPNNAMAYYYLGYCQVMAGNTKEGAVALTLFLQKQPNPSIQDYLTRVKAKLTPADQQWVDAQTAATSNLTQPANADLEREINALLKILDEESDYLKTRMALDDYRLQEQEKELEALQTTQDDVNSVFRKSNKSSGSPHFTYTADNRTENLHLSGITVVGATHSYYEFTLGVWSDLGGEGAFTMNINGSVPDWNSSSAPVSFSVNSSSLNFNVDGMLGHWSNTVAVEAYSFDTDLGDFTRGAGTNSLRFEDPFDIKRYSGDKNQKCWDDYMTNLGFVPSTASWTNQNQSMEVFDGLYMVGTKLPLVSKDAKLNLLVGRTDGDPHRWEEGLRYSQPWANGLLQTSLSTEWVNEDELNASVTQANMGMKSCAGYFGLDFKPVVLGFELGYSHLYTGIYNSSVTSYAPNGNIKPLTYDAPAGQTSLNLYPLTFYYTAISDEFSNFQSKVVLGGIQFWKFGFPGQPVMDDNFGYVGLPGDLVSDRYGWRVNLGWKGRQESWTKPLPDFLDDIIINLDVAQRTEYQSMQDELGYYPVEAYNLISVFYPEDNGIFGTMWSNWGTTHFAGQEYVNNIEGLRNDGNNFGQYVINFGPPVSERIPLIIAADSNYQPVPVGTSPATHPVTTISGGPTTISNYVYLSNLKTYHYVTLTLKPQLNKIFKINTPFYAGLFFTDNQVAGTSGDPSLEKMPDPNRPGQTLGNIPNLFEQTVYDAAFLYGVFNHVNLLVDYGLELWKSNYTYPRVDYRTDSVGTGFAYDIPWSGCKWEFRYKHINFRDLYVSANSYQADQVYSFFLFQF